MSVGNPIQTGFKVSCCAPVVQYNSVVPIPVQTQSGGTDWFADVDQVGVADSHSAAIKTDGTLWLWGYGGFGRLGNNSTINRSSPVQTVSTGTNWKQVSIGCLPSAAIKTDGTLWLWGFSGNGELGTNSTIPQSSPVQTVSTGTNWKQVSAGGNFSTATKTDGTLWSWGANIDGNLGNNSTISQSSPVQTVSTGTNWKQVSAGQCHIVSIKTDGTLWIWGNGACGKLGILSVISQSSPVQTVSTGTNWKQVSAGYRHSAGVKTDGTLWLWGNNVNVGQLGNNSTISQSSPVQTISTGTNWKQVNASTAHTLAVKIDGTLWSWGLGNSGRLGNYNTIPRSSPVQTISTGTNWKQVGEGLSFTSAAIKVDGTLWLWGNNFVGQVGTGEGFVCNDRSSPVQTVSTGNDWKIDSNTEFTAANTFILSSDVMFGAIKTDGTLWLWGSGSFGRLGNNYTNNQSSPVQTLSTGTNWKQVSGGGAFVSAIKTDGTLWLWGFNTTGHLGTNNLITQSSPVQTVSTGTNWNQVSSATGHSVAIKTDGTLWTWGCGDSARLGTNSTIDQSSPVQTVSTGTNWKEASVGSAHSAAIKTDGTLWLWGNNFAGSMGNGCNITSSSPVQTVSTGTNWKQVSLGCSHSAAIKTDGTLWLWGCAVSGRLGNNSTTDRNSPVQTVSTGTNWKQIDLSRGLEGSAAIKTDGTLWLWGAGSCGVLGNLSTISQSSPVQTVSTGTNWCEVGFGSNSVGATKTDGTLWLWGSKNSGILGNLSAVDITPNQSSPVQTVSSGTEWTEECAWCSFSIGYSHSAAIKTDGTLWLWGLASAGRLGNQVFLGTRCSPVQTVSSGTNWKQVSLGFGHSAAIKTDGTLWLWGCGGCGQLGINWFTSCCSPVQTISTGNNWKQVSLGKYFSAAVKTDGTLWLWGDGGSGKFGNYSTILQSSPVQTVSTGTNWKQVSLGCFHAAAIKTDGTLWLWGSSYGGSLGTNSTINHSSPVQTVSTGTNWKQVSGGCRFSAAIKTDGTLWLWGTNGGRLGTNSTIDQSSPVQTVSTGTNWKQVGTGNFHAAAIKTDGTLWLWGSGTNGVLGNNCLSDQSSPIQTISTGTNWKQVSSGGSCTHTAALTENNELYMWGNNNFAQLNCNPIQPICTNVVTDLGSILVEKETLIDLYPSLSLSLRAPRLLLWGNNCVGQLGTNDTIDRSSPTQTISTGTNWKQISLGCFHAAAIKTDGTLWLWGNSFSGTLGNNSTINRSSPVQTVSTGTNWKQVSAGDGLLLAIKTDGTLWTWGGNFSGQLGTNSNINQSSPVQTVSTGTNWKQVSAGILSAAAIKTDGTLWTWGNNGNGGLGNNSRINQSSPVQTVSTGTNWKQVNSGFGIFSAIKTDGTLWLWGLNGNGQLATNSTIAQSSPVQTVSTGTNWKQVSTTSCHTAAIKTDGTLWIWGSNGCGALGTNSTINQSSPVQTVSTGTNWKQTGLGIPCGSATIKTDGTLWIWGCNSTQLDGGTNTFNILIPKQTTFGGNSWKQVCLGCGFIAAIKEEGDF